ncbi:MAG: response regulator [Alphaproteobacteria bacterium]|nr:response regulator [Alphaproteobacteria bacterium]
MRTLLKGVLRTLGLRNIRESTDGPSALKELNLVSIDLLITEYALDMLDGHDLTRLVRTASDICNPYVPVIMLTSFTERHVVARARDVGVNEFLAKPISAEALYARLVGIVFHPRDFVVTHNFLGPDRRRRQMKFKGDERRFTPSKLLHPPPLVTEEMSQNVTLH